MVVVATLLLGAALAPGTGGAVGGTDPADGTPTRTATPVGTADDTRTETGSGTATPTDGVAPTRRGTLIGVQGSGSYTERGYAELVVDGARQWALTEEDTYFDVSPLPGGRAVAAWMSHGLDDCGPYPAPCARTGFVVVDTDGAAGDPEVLERFSIPVRTDTNSEIHDVEPLPGGRFAVADMDRERLLIVEDGEIVWQWNASSFYEAPPDPTRRDWLHVNDVDRIGDGRFLLSIRNANQLLVLQRRGDDAEVVEVINRDRGGDDASCTEGPRLYDADGDGDVRCGDPSVFKEQHNPQWLGDGAVLVADSDNDRAVELHRRGDRWVPVWVLTGANGRSFQWPRDADRLPNGNTLVADSRGRRVVEVTQSGEVVSSYSTGNGIVYEADRLPYGEPVGAPLYATGQPPTGGDETATAGGDGDDTAGPPAATGTDGPVVVGERDTLLPVFGPAASLLRAGLPWLPLWLQGAEVAGVTLGLLLIGGGLLDRRRSTE